jgi:hypothetical protein
LRPGKPRESRVRGYLASLLLAACVLAACDAPKDAKPVGAAVVEPPPQLEPLPDEVAKTVELLKQTAAQGSYRDLARLANITPDFRSNNGGMSHAEYWDLKQRTGDFPAIQIEKVLAYPHAVADSAQGRVFIWPYMAMLKPEEITPSAAREIDRLLGEGQARELRNGAVWSGYVLGIREDGLWLYFVSGSG